MSNVRKFVLDANVFIQTKKQFYCFDFCPGFWEGLIWYREQGRLLSIDKVYDELERGGDDLSKWVTSQFKRGSFASTSDADITTAYGQMVTWVMAQPGFTPAARTEFLTVADSWLAAFAKARGYVVVTLEVLNSDCKRKVPLPNVCKQFAVDFITPFQMLRELPITLTWNAPSSQPRV